MKNLNRQFLELYNDRKSVILTIVLISIGYWLDSFLLKDTSIMYGSSIALIITSSAIAATALTAGIAQKVSNDKSAARSMSKADRAAQKLSALENSRQEILNQGAKIRSMKAEVFNPYANIAVATKGTELQMEQTDEALANTLDQINQSGTGAGGATALARMAAKSKAQIGASIEKQEIGNQQLRLQGEASMVQQKMTLEKDALRAEEAAYGRQEGREMQQLNRMQTMQDNAEQQALAFKMAGDQALMAGISGATNSMTSMAGGL